MRLNDVLLSVKKDIKNKILFFLGLLIFAFPILPNAIQSISILFFIGFSIFFYFSEKSFSFSRQQYVGFAVTTFWVVFLCVTILYSDDKSYGFRMLQRYVNIIVAPLVFIFFVPSFFFHKRHYFYLSFVISNLLFILIIYYKAIYVVEATCFPEIYYNNFLDKLRFILKKPNHVVFSCFENETNHSFFIHRVYNSMNFLFSILLLIEILFYKNFKKNTLFYIFSFISIMVFGYLLFYQFSVVNIGLALLLIPLLILMRIKQRRLRILFIIFSLMSISVLFVISGRDISSNKVASKYLTPALNLVIKVFTERNYGNIDERYEINKANKELIGRKPFFGYGIGDAQNNLKNYYSKHKTENSVFEMAFIENLNSHNNYAFLLLSGGVVLILFYLMNVIFCFNLGIVNKEWIYIAFMIIIGSNLLAENILSRIHGTLFYSLFNALFIASLIRKEKPN